MFKEEYILDLLSGQLTQKGYASIVGSIGSMVRRYQWQKNIVVSGSHDSNWSDDDIIELSQQFFEWIITKNKLAYVNKVPSEYLSYYFTQMFVSFVASRIKEEQQNIGVSFQKCQIIVKEICDEDYTTVSHLGRLYISNPMATTKQWIDDLEDNIKYIAHYPITEKTKHYKPIIKLAIEDILLSTDGYILTDVLASAVFQLLDQSAFSLNDENKETATIQTDEANYTSSITRIIEGVSKVEAHIYLDYIFQDSGKVSLSDLASKYNMPKSTLHKKIEDFKKKIYSSYIPENEEDGISFLQCLANKLDEIAK